MNAIFILLAVACTVSGFATAMPRTAIVSLMVSAEVNELLLLSLQCSCNMHDACPNFIRSQGKQQQHYTNCLRVFVNSLRGIGYKGEIVILVGNNSDPFQIQQIQELNVVMKIVPTISAKKSPNPSLLNMLTKLHLWNLLDYTQVMYFDSDFIFLRDPSPAFLECGLSPFCACIDTGIKHVGVGRMSGERYFNSGFMVLRPSRNEFAYLQKHLYTADGTTFVDQDMLNNLYQGKWKRLDSKYNVMHIQGEIDPRTVAIHEKLWILQQKYPTGNWIWNKDKTSVEANLQRSQMSTKLRKQRLIGMNNQGRGTSANRRQDKIYPFHPIA